MIRVRPRSPKTVSASTAHDSDSDAASAVDLGRRPDATSTSAEAVEAARFLVWDKVDEWGAQSFPASDPPANW
jgi:hypothetical protein